MPLTNLKNVDQYGRVIPELSRLPDPEQQDLWSQLNKDAVRRATVPLAAAFGLPQLLTMGLSAKAAGAGRTVAPFEGWYRGHGPTTTKEEAAKERVYRGSGRNRGLTTRQRVDRWKQDAEKEPYFEKFFSPKREFASLYGKPEVYNVETGNFFDYDNPEHWARLEEAFKKRWPHNYEKKLKQFEGYKNEVLDPDPRLRGHWNFLESPFFRGLTREAGFNGMMVQEQYIKNPVAFSADQIEPVLPYTKPKVTSKASPKTPYVKPKVTRTWPETLDGTLGSVAYAEQYGKSPELKDAALKHAYKQKEYFDSRAAELSQLDPSLSRDQRFAQMEKRLKMGTMSQYWREAIEIMEGRGSYITDSPLLK